MVDSCVLLDLFPDDPVWADWSNAVLEEYAATSLYTHFPTVEIIAPQTR